MLLSLGTACINVEEGTPSRVSGGIIETTTDSATMDATTDDTASIGESTDGSSSNDETGTPTLCSPGDGTCQGTTPICSETGLCQACSTDAQCLDQSPTTPICLATGACVQCIAASNTDPCQDKTPVCGDNNTCRACERPSECPIGTTCQLDPNSNDIGACINVDLAVCVDVDDEHSECSVVYASLQEAIDAVVDNESTSIATITVYEHDSTPYEGAEISTDQQLVIVAAPGESPLMDGDTDDPTFLFDGTNATLEGLHIQNSDNRNNADGIEATNASTLALFNVSIADTGHLGIDLDSSTLTMTDSSIANTGSHGVALSSSQATLFNTSITNTHDRGASLNNTSHLTITNGSIISSGDDGVRLNSNSSLTMTDGFITGGGDDGIEAIDSSITLTRVLVGGENGSIGALFGIRADGGIQNIFQSRIINNQGGGISIQGGAEMHLTNSFVSAPNDAVAVQIQDASSRGIILYSTLGAGFGLDETRGLQCSEEGNTETSIRNSIVLTQLGTALQCDGATTPGTRVYDVNSDINAENGFDTDWFENFGSGNFHLSPNSDHPFDGVAIWTTGDPIVDIDGNPRFNGMPTDGAPDVPGADSLTPIELQN